MHANFPVPDACTLPTAAQPLRLAEFDALFATTLRGQERRTPQHLRLTLAGAAGLEVAVRDLTTRESACCAFFDFTVTPAHGTAAATETEPETVILDVKVPPAQTVVLDGLTERAQQATPPATG